jgi:hypothetical protein
VLGDGGVQIVGDTNPEARAISTLRLISPWSVSGTPSTGSVCSIASSVFSRDGDFLLGEAPCPSVTWGRAKSPARHEDFLAAEIGELSERHGAPPE